MYGYFTLHNLGYNVKKYSPYITLFQILQMGVVLYYCGLSILTSSPCISGYLEIQYLMNRIYVLVYTTYFYLFLQLYIDKYLTIR